MSITCESYSPYALRHGYSVSYNQSLASDSSADFTKGIVVTQLWHKTFAGPQMRRQAHLISDQGFLPADCFEMWKEFARDEISGRGWTLKILIPIPSWRLHLGNTSMFVVDAVVWIGHASVQNTRLCGTATFAVSHLCSDTEIAKHT